MSVTALGKSPTSNSNRTAEIGSLLSQSLGSGVSVIEYLEGKSCERVHSNIYEEEQDSISTTSLLPKILDAEKAIFSQMYQEIVAGSIQAFFTRDIKTFHGRGEVSREGWQKMCVEYAKMCELYHKVEHVHPLSFLSWVSSERMIKDNLKEIKGYNEKWPVFLRLINREMIQAPGTQAWLGIIEIAPWGNIIQNFQKSMNALYNTEDLCTDAFLETMPKGKRKDLQKCIQDQKYEVLFNKVLEP